MPPSTPPYRFALGSLYEDESYIVHSTKGIGWCNIPRELENIISNLGTSDLIDFSLGSHGRFYVKYMSGGVVKRRLSRGLWDEIQQNHQETLDRLTLGEDGDHWGIMELSDADGSWDQPFSDAHPSFQSNFRGKIRQVGGYDSVKFVALGYAGDWAFNVNGDVLYSGPESFKKAMRDAKRQGKEVVDVVFSRLERYWLIMMSDGSVSYRLRGGTCNLVAGYMTRQYMLGVRQAPAPASTPIPVPQLLVPLPFNDWRYTRVETMFYDGWAHAHKPDQTIEAIYKVILPDSLNGPYQAYQNALTRRGHGELGNEQIKFHGTPRSCSLGDNPRSLNPCLRASCNLCCILRTSFQVSRAGTAIGRNFLRFGHGIYTTSASSKADDYNGDPSASNFKAMLVARVALGRGAQRYRTSQGMVAPPPGFHSVLGEVGHDLNYDEQVVYRDDAIRPAYLVIYGPRVERIGYAFAF